MKLKKTLCIILSLVVFLGLLGGCASGEGGEENATFSVGYGQTDITPSGSVSLTGFGDSDERFSTRVTEPLYATAIAVKDSSGDIVIIIAYDLISSGEIERIEKILAQERKEKSHGEDPCRAA